MQLTAADLVVTKDDGVVEDHTAESNSLLIVLSQVISGTSLKTVMNVDSHNGFEA